MSASVLYLLIIAIWAGFLVPAWIRRGHARGRAESALDADAYLEEADDSVPGDDETGLPLAGRGDRPGDPVEFEEDDAISWEEAPAGPLEQSPRHQVTFEDDYHAAEYYADAEPEITPRADERFEEHPGERNAAHRKAQQAAHQTARSTAARIAQVGRSPQSRQQMLRARRRMLTMLLALTAVTAAGTAMRLLPWWACIPPAAMLLLYVLLLREVAMAEAEIAAHRRDAAMAHAASRRPARAVVNAGRQERQERTAEIIDISSRVSDQLYDQYDDDAVRAVGD